VPAAFTLTLALSLREREQIEEKLTYGIFSTMQRFSTFLSLLFGYMFLALSALVTFETILRKLFNMSIQGADELGGYALAVGWHWRLPSP
jgi:hypothetical protein